LHCRHDAIDLVLGVVVVHARSDQIGQAALGHVELRVSRDGDPDVDAVHPERIPDGGAVDAVDRERDDRTGLLTLVVHLHTGDVAQPGAEALREDAVAGGDLVEPPRERVVDRCAEPEADRDAVLEVLEALRTVDEVVGAR
jgi:hypothetical protein